MQYSINVADAKLDAIESTIGTTATLTIWSGTMPANCSVANNGTALATVTLPADWMAAASGGSKSKSGTWSDSSADASGTAAYFRIHDGSAVCHVQGSVGTSGADMIVDSTSFTAGQTFTVSTFTITAGNL